MAEYALITDEAPYTDVGKRHNFKAGEDIPDLSQKGWKWVPMVQGTEPTLNDPTTEKIVDDDPLITADAFTMRRKVVTMSQSEQERRAKELAHQTAGSNKELWIDTLEAGNATPAQVQKALAWSIRQHTGIRR